jgi:hypothetical protein
LYLGKSPAISYRRGMKYRFVVVTLLAACSGGDGNSTADAGDRADAPVACPVPGTPLATGMHTLFVSFEGVTLTLDACDDATTNCSSLVAQSPTTVPPFLGGAGARAARIQTITGMVVEALAPFSVDVVTTRPSAGDYRMVSVGGDTTLASSSTDPLLAVVPVCDAANKHGIALVFEQPADDMVSDRAYADTIAGAFGRLAGLLPTSRNGDCMCTQTTCTHSQACTWATGAVVAAGNTCSRTMQNEHELLIAAVGCR